MAVRFCFAMIALTLSIATSTASAAVVAKAVGPSVTNDLNLTSLAFTIPPTTAATPAALSTSGNWLVFTEGGRYFGMSARAGGNDNTPMLEVVDPDPSFASLDDSTTFATDVIGVIKAADFDNFFGLSDTVNANNSNADNAPDTTYSAIWTFNVGSASGGLSISFDAAAMGDFEAPSTAGGDNITIEYSFDGVTYTSLATSNIKDTSFTTTQLADPATITDLDVVYTLETGTLVAHNDPLTLNGSVLDNNFANFSFDVGSAASSSLRVRLTASSSGTAETFLIRNLTISDGGMTGGLPGDANGDGKVDLLDLDILGANFGSTTGATVGQGDFNEDGAVDLLDLDILGANFGSMLMPGVAVPEPTGLLLAAVAGALAVWRR